MPERLGLRLRTANPCGVATKITGVRRARNGLPLQAHAPAAHRTSWAEAALIFLYHNTCGATRFLPGRPNSEEERQCETIAWLGAGGVREAEGACSATVQALAEFERSLERQPDRGQTLFDMGILLLENRDDTEGAVGQYTGH